MGQYNKEAPFELIDGERVPVNLMVISHSTTVNALYNPLSKYVERKGLGEIFFRLPYVIPDEDDLIRNSRLPDLMFIGAESLEKYKTDTRDWNNKPLVAVPDLVVQVVANDEPYMDARIRTKRFLSDGVNTVWALFLPWKDISVYQHAKESPIGLNNILTGNDVIPGFAIPAAVIFRDLLRHDEEVSQKIVRQIEEAFADTPYPGDSNIGWGCGWEGKEFERVLRGKHWKELSLEIIFTHRDELPCTTPEGFRFYLPAFMLATLLHYDEIDTLSGNLISSLSPDNGDLYEHSLKHLSKFARDEQVAILAFLKSYLKLHPGDYGLDSPVYGPILEKGIEFWEQRLQESSDDS